MTTLGVCIRARTYELRLVRARTLVVLYELVVCINKMLNILLLLVTHTMHTSSYHSIILLASNNIIRSNYSNVQHYAWFIINLAFHYSMLKNVHKCGGSATTTPTLHERRHQD